MANNAINSLNFENNTYTFTLPYGSCSTAAGTAAKTVDVDNFSLEKGARVAVKFTVTNTAANPTLNVESTGAKAIYYNGAAITAGYLKANKTYEFVYNGTQWDLIGDVDTNTTYTFNGAVSTIKDSNLTASRALVSDSSGKVAVSAVTSTELGYLDGVTSAIQTQLNNKLDKTTYEYNKELALGGTGKVCIGKFPCYDSNISVEIKSTTSTAYNGTLVIYTQNINTSKGGTYGAVVYGDASNTLTDSIKIQYLSGSNVFSVYIDLPGWSKNLLHIQCVSLAGTPTDIATTVTEIPSTATIVPTNALTSNFAAKSTATTSADGLMSAADKTKLNGVASGAEVNQNAFSNIKIGSTTIAADSKTDTLTLVAGNNVTITPDATNDKITIASTDTTYTFNGAVSTIKDSNLTASRALVSDSSGKVAVSAVTSTELGYLDGVTSAIQTQLNGKAPTSHASTATTYGIGTNSNYGHVKLSDSTSSTSAASAGIAASPAAVKAAYDLAASKTANTGTITEVKANGTSIATSGSANIPAATTSKYGVTKLSSSTSSTSTSLAATPSAVKAAYDLANEAKTLAGAGTFTAIHGTTTSAEIEAAYQAGKTILLTNSSNNGRMIGQLYGRASDIDHTFLVVQNNLTLGLMRCLNNEWSLRYSYTRNQGGTMQGALVAANGDIFTKQMRNIYAGTADMTEGVSELASGDIYIVYE